MPNMVCRCSEGKKEGSGRIWLRPSWLLLPVSRYCATKNAVRCDTGCSAVRWQMQCTALADAACCVFLPIARHYFGEASSPSKPSAFCCFLIPSEKSCQCFCVMRASAFCCAGLCVLLRGPFVFSCAGQCLLLRGSVPSLVRFCAFFLREPMAWQVWVAAVEMTWGWDCEAWGCGPGLPGWRVRGNRQVR